MSLVYIEPGRVTQWDNRLKTKPMGHVLGLGLARTILSLKKTLVLAILANLTTSGRVFLTEMVKRHIYGPRPFI